MSVNQRRWTTRKGEKKSAWYVDFTYRFPDGTTERVIETSPVNTRRGAERYEQQLAAQCLNGTYNRRADRKAKGARKEANPSEKVIPTIREFAATFVEIYAKNNNKASEVDSKESLLRHHIIPHLGDFRLDEVGPQIEWFKSKLKNTHAFANKNAAGKKLSAKRINNVLTCLTKLLRFAAEDCHLIPAVPIVRPLKVPPSKFDFLDFPAYRQVLNAARQYDHAWYTMILMAGDAGLRRGELRAIEWHDIDFAAGDYGELTVNRAYWREKLGTPKSGKARTIPLTPALREALLAHKHDHRLVFCQLDGGHLTQGKLVSPLAKICERAGLAPKPRLDPEGATYHRICWHALRHTFCSHLAMLGVPVTVIKELAGHSDLKTTERYMHLAPRAKRDGIAKLAARPSALAPDVAYTSHTPKEDRSIAANCT